MKKVIIFLCVLILFGAHETKTYATSIQDMAKEKLQSSDIGQLDSLVEEDGSEILPGFTFSDAAKTIASGSFPFEATGLLQRILRLLFGEVYNNLSLLLKIIAIAVLFAFLNNLKGSFGHQGVSDAAYLVCYIILAGVLFRAFLQAANLTRDVVDGVTTFATGIVPIMISFMLASGAISSAAALNPVVLISIQVITNLAEYFLIPLFYVIAALSLVDNLNEKFPVTKLTALLKKSIKWSMCFIFTLLVGIIMVQGLSASVLDEATQKAAKYLVGSFVPVVGGILSDTVDAMASCMKVVKNAAGVAGIVAIALICLAPMLKLAAMSVMFYITAAVVEPVADKRIVKCIDAMGSTVGMMVGLTAAVGLMFIICISMIIGMGNSAMLG